MTASKIELLSPAGDMACLQTALRFGADAVYCGGPKLQLRSGTVGFSMEDLSRAAQLAHSRGKKLYVTVNAFARNEDIDGAGDYAAALHCAGADAVIVSDLGMIRAIHAAVPDLDIHVSTQANCLNYAAACTYYDMGAKRVVLGREMTLEQIRRLRKRVPEDLELEAFVHGAMCMAYSGRCMISAYLTGRSANRGACTQSCRWKYHLMEQTRPGEYFPVEENEEGMTILSSFDMNCMDFLDQLLDAGITSFKIEGRMKTCYYVATVTNAYRRRIDALLAGTAEEGQLALLQRELNSISHRPYAGGFYFGEMKHHASDDGVYLQDATFVGVAREQKDGRLTFELRNRVFEGDVLEILSPASLGESFPVRNIIDQVGNPRKTAGCPGELYSCDCDVPVVPGDLLRIRKK